MRFEFEEKYDATTGGLRPGEWFLFNDELYLTHDKTTISQQLYSLIDTEQVSVVRLTLSYSGMEISHELLPAKTIVTVLEYRG